MIRRHVLRALAAGVAAGDEDAARAALGTIDWVVRWPARRRLERALIDAALAVPEATGDPEDVRHVLRIAALRVAGRRCQPDDRDAAAAAYRVLRYPPLPRPWLATIAAALVGVVVVGGLGRAAVRWWLRAGNRSYARARPAPAVGAFRTGGQPLADAAVAELLAHDLMQLVIESDDQRRSGQASAARAAHSAALLAPAAITAHGAGLAAAWRTMIETLDRWVGLPADDAAFGDLDGKLVEAVRAVKDAFAAADLGYYVEGSVLTSGDARHAVVYSYRVEDVGFVSAAGKPRRVLALRRLDRLNLSHAMLGMESSELGDPVLLLDQIDAHVASKTLPVLARDVPYPLGDPSWAALAEAAPVARAAGAAVRRELVRCLGDDADDGAEIAALLSERAAIVERWRGELAHRDIAMAQTNDLFLPEDLVPRLDGLVSSSQRARVKAIEDQLARLEAPRIAARLQELVVSTVRRHEAQHGVDDERGPQWMTAGVDASAAPSVGAARLPSWARAEISAYTSQIANDPVTPQLVYWHVAGFAFDRHAWGRAESYAGLLITAGLAQHLKVTGAGPLLYGGEIDRGRLATLAAGIAAASDDALRDAARATWQDLFREPLAPIVDGLR